MKADGDHNQILIQTHCFIVRAIVRHCRGLDEGVSLAEIGRLPAGILSAEMPPIDDAMREGHAHTHGDGADDGNRVRHRLDLAVIA